VGIVLPHRSYLRNSSQWFELCDSLAAENVAYRLFVAGDEIVDRSLVASELNECPYLLVPEVEGMLTPDRQMVEEQAKTPRILRTAKEVLETAPRVVKVETEGTVRALARAKTGAAVVHLLNYEYDDGDDSVRPLKEVAVRLDPDRLDMAGASTCRFLTPDSEPISLVVKEGKVEVPELGLWGILVLGQP
jgi:hypothetical protein